MRPPCVEEDPAGMVVFCGGLDPVLLCDAPPGHPPLPGARQSQASCLDAKGKGLRKSGELERRHRDTKLSVALRTATRHSPRRLG